MSTEAVHFSITGEFITNHARDRWVEEDYEGAMDVLDTMIGLPDDEKMKIILGKRKLVGVNELELADDDVTEHHGMKLLTQLEVIAKQKEIAAYDAQRAADTIAYQTPEDHVRCASPWGFVDAPPSVVVSRAEKGGVAYNAINIPYDEFKERFPGLVYEAQERMRIADERKARGQDPDRQVVDELLDDQQARMQESAADIVAQITGQRKLEVSAGAKTIEVNGVEVIRGTPADKTGWLLPDGKFYLCSYMMHDALAESLGNDTAKVEGKWIRVVHPSAVPYVPGLMPGGPFTLCFLKRAPTKKQIKFMWDYCEHHKLIYPQEEIDGCGGY